VIENFNVFLRDYKKVDYGFDHAYRMIKQKEEDEKQREIAERIAKEQDRMDTQVRITC